MPIKTAIPLGPAKGDWRGPASIFRMDPPVTYTDIRGESHPTPYVVYSAVDFWDRDFNYGFAYESAIFPSNRRGEPLDTGELAAVQSDIDPPWIGEVFDQIGYQIEFPKRIDITT